MEKKDIRVLALDLDGTLTNDQKVVTPATRAALDTAAAKGDHRAGLGTSHGRHHAAGKGAGTG